MQPTDTVHLEEDQIRRLREDLLDTLDEEFEMENCFTEDHETPFDTIQNFIFCHFKKK